MQLTRMEVGRFTISCQYRNMTMEKVRLSPGCMLLLSRKREKLWEELGGYTGSMGRTVVDRRGF